VFDDPWALSQQDRIVDGEIRWQITGLFEGQALLTVAYVVLEDEPDDEVIRIVSARRSTRKERRIYEETRQKNDG